MPSIVSSQRFALATPVEDRLGRRASARSRCSRADRPPGRLSENRKPTSCACTACGARRSSSGPLPKKLYGAGRLKSRSVPGGPVVTADVEEVGGSDHRLQAVLRAGEGEGDLAVLREQVEVGDPGAADRPDLFGIRVENTAA